MVEWLEVQIQICKEQCEKTKHVRVYDRYYYRMQALEECLKFYTKHCL